MTILKGITAIALGAGVLVLGFSNNVFHEGNMPKIQTGDGKMTVLFNGVEHGNMGFGNEKWAPGESRTATVEILNEGEIDFLASVDTGDYPAGNIVKEFDTTIKTESGKTLFKGWYSNIFIKELDIPVGASTKLSVSVSWMPPENVDLSKPRTGDFEFKVFAEQKI